IVEQSAGHVRWDLAGALLVKLMPRLEVETTIGTQRSLETGMEEIAGLDHDHAGSAAIGTAVGQPKERHPLSLAPSSRHEGGRMVPPPRYPVGWLMSGCLGAWPSALS